MCNLSGQSEERENDINGDADETHGLSDANASVISDEDTIRMCMPAQIYFQSISNVLYNYVFKFSERPV
jgi:hypothetical protein